MKLYLRRTLERLDILLSFYLSVDLSVDLSGMKL